MTTSGVRSSSGPTQVATRIWQRVRELSPRRRDLSAMGRQPRRDVIAGLTVAVVALPLALAFGISSGLGATAGLVTAVLAGAVAAVFGGSHVQVSGPTGAMTVVLVPIVAEFGRSGVLVVGLMAGVILLGLAFAGAGRFMRYVPLPVIEGFTVGIALIIALQQVPSMLGLTATHERIVVSAVAAVGDWAQSPHWAPVLLALGVAASMLAAGRLRPGLPMSLLAVVAATVISSVADLPVTAIGDIPAGFPAPHVPTIPLDHLTALVLPAVAVAVLAALESLLSATVADAMGIGERHDSDRELFGQGVANLAVPFFGGVPATAAIARTAVNVRSGAHSRLAAVVQSLALVAVMFGASQLVSEIPTAALSGVLIATAARMVQISSVMALARATRGDAAVLVITTVTTLAFDLVTAVIVGFVAAGGFALRQMAKSARIDKLPPDDVDHRSEEQAVLDEHIVVYRLDGPLFFGAAHAFLLELSEVSDVRVVVLRMSRVATLDATGAAVLADTITRLEARHVSVMLSGIRPGHGHVLTQLGVYDQLAHERHIFDHTPDAIAHARIHAARAPHV